MKIIKRLLFKICRIFLHVITLGNVERYKEFSQKIGSVYSSLKHKQFSRRYNQEIKKNRLTHADIRKLFVFNAQREKYARFDTIVRYLAIENYYGLNDYGFKLYKKMQVGRLQSEEEADKWCDRFRKLIKSFEENGYKEDSPLNVAYDLNIHDGSHRSALCLYFEIYDVPVRMLNISKTVEYGMGWFEENGFELHEIIYIIKKYNELIEKFNLPESGTLIVSDHAIKNQILSMLKKTYHVIEQGNDKVAIKFSNPHIYYDLEKNCIKSGDTEKVNSLISEKFENCRVVWDE